MQTIKNYLLLVLALLVLGLSALAWKQSREITALRAASLNSDERADWQKRVWAAQKRTQSLEAQLAARRPGGSDSAADSNSSDRGPPSRATVGRMMAGFASMMDRPEAARLMAIQQKTQVDARYAALFRKLGLPPDKLAQLKALLGEKLSTPIDVMTAAGQQGINPMQNPQEFRQLVQNAQAETDEKIKSLLDPSAYAQYQNYVQTEPQRAIVSQLQQSLSYTDAPLSAAQADQLTQILAETSPARASGPVIGAAVTYTRTAGPDGNVVVAMGSPPPEGPMGGALWGGSPITDAAVTQAQGVLSAPQIQALQEMQQQQQAAAQLRQQMMQNAPAGSPPPPPPPPPPG